MTKKPDPEWWVVMRSDTSAVVACAERANDALADARRVLAADDSATSGTRIMKVKDARKNGVAI